MRKYVVTSFSLLLLAISPSLRAAAITSGTVLATAGTAANDNGSSGWRIDWTDANLSVNYTVNPGYDPAGPTAKYLQGTLDITADFFNLMSKSIYFTDVTPGLKESPDFGGRCNVNFTISDKTGTADFDKFSMLIETLDTLPDADNSGGAGHPWNAHFHPAGFDPGTLTLVGPLNNAGNWANPSFRANFSGNIPDLGAAVQIKGVGVHDYESNDDSNGVDGRIFRIVLIPDVFVPEPGTFGLAGLAFAVLAYRRR